MAEKTSSASAPKKAEAADISKMECVRRAMAQLGNDAGRAEIQSFIKQKFGIDMNADIISTYKADIARKMAKSAAPTAAAKKMPAPQPQTKPSAPAMKKPAAPAPVAKKTALAVSQPHAKASAGGIGLKDIQAVKDLVGRVGPDSLKTLVDVLAK